MPSMIVAEQQPKPQVQTQPQPATYYEREPTPSPLPPQPGTTPEGYTGQWTQIGAPQGYIPIVKYVTPGTYPYRDPLKPLEKTAPATLPYYQVSYELATPLPPLSPVAKAVIGMQIIAATVFPELFKNEPIQRAYLDFSTKAMFFALGETAVFESNIVGIVNLGSSAVKSVQTGQLQYSPAINVRTAPTSVSALVGSAMGNPAETKQMSELPESYALGSAFGEVGFTVLTGEVIGYAARPLQTRIGTWVGERALARSMAGETPTFARATTAEGVLLRVTGSRMDTRLAPQIATLGKDIGLEEWEFAISPRSSALIMPYPEAPARFAPQIVSLPFKEVLTVGTLTRTPVISRQLLEAQDASWDLMTTPKSSGVQIWKTPIVQRETSMHYLTLISREGYTTISGALTEKPFSSGFLSAPQQIGLTTTSEVTRIWQKTQPYVPSFDEDLAEPQRLIPYTGARALPQMETRLPMLLAPAIPNISEKADFNVFTREMPIQNARQQAITQQTPALEGTVQQLTFPTPNISIPSFDIPDITIPTKPTPDIPGDFNLPFNLPLGLPSSKDWLGGGPSSFGPKTKQGYRLFLWEFPVAGPERALRELLL